MRRVFLLDKIITNLVILWPESNRSCFEIVPKLVMVALTLINKTSKHKAH